MHNCMPISMPIPIPITLRYPIPRENRGIQ